jgi:hypothetical protein
MWISILLLIHVAVFLMKNEEYKKKDLEKRINSPVNNAAPNRFTIEESGYYDPDKQERERIARRNRQAVEEIDRVYKMVGALRELNKL